MKGFNSQPPEGGWMAAPEPCLSTLLFQLTAARRRLELFAEYFAPADMFQLTAARRRLVGAGYG